MNYRRVDADRTVDAYFAEVRGTVMLSAEEERALFLQYRTCTKCAWAFPVDGVSRVACVQCGAKRNLRARDKLIHGALRFVIKLARDYALRARGVEKSADTVKQLISAGNLGLLIAVDRFELSRGTRFLTYATWWIKEKIREDLDNSGLVHVPAYRQKQLRLRRRQGEDVEFDAAVVAIEPATAMDDADAEDPGEADLVNRDGAALLYRAMDALQLDLRHRYILIAYFGVREEPKNLRQISSRLNLSSERVRQIKSQALLRLRHYFQQCDVAASTEVLSDP